MMSGKSNLMEDQPAKIWKIVGASVRGTAHVRAGLPNQDAITWVPESGQVLPLIMAVSDGHGSAKCFRSELGASLAVKTAIQVVQVFLNSQLDSISLSAIKQAAEEQLPQSLVHSWQDAVQDSLLNNPFSSEELAALEQKDGTPARQIVEANPYVAYGATLLIVLVANSFIIYLQLGDGDILTVSEQGGVSRPLSRDESLFANETTSLCSAKAWCDTRVAFHTSANSPALILLATDGYANSFREDAGFLKVGSDLLEIIRTDGLDKVNESLETWLAETTKAGSGDDITLGILCRMDTIREGICAASRIERDQQPK